MYESSDTSSSRSLDPRTPRSEPRSPWTYMGSTRLNLRDIDQFPDRITTKAHVHYPYTSSEKNSHEHSHRIQRPTDSVATTSRAHAQKPSMQFRSHGYRDLAPKASPPQDYWSAHDHDTTYAKSPRSEFRNGTRNFNDIDPAQIRNFKSPNPDYTVPPMDFTRLRNGDQSHVTPRHQDIHRNIAITHSPPPDYIDNDNRIVKTPESRMIPNSHAQRPSRSNEKHARAAINRTGGSKRYRAKSAPPRIQHFDPTKNIKQWAMWRIAATEKIIDETKSRTKGLKKGDKGTARFGPSLEHPSPQLANCIDVTLSTRKRVNKLMDRGDRNSASELLTKQFIYFGVPRVSLTKNMTEPRI